MRALVWLALTIACLGYWWHVQRHEVKNARRCPAHLRGSLVPGVTCICTWTEQDNKDTADAVERLYEAPS